MSHNSMGIHRPQVLLFLASLLVATPASLSAQQAASSLLGLTQRAEGIAQVKVLQTRVIDQTRHVVLRVQSTLKGSMGETIELSEPTGRTCGRALGGLAVGASYLAFLADLGRPRLVVGSARGLLAIDPEVLAHVRGLIAASDPAGRIALLTRALTARNERVRRDAAAILPRLVGLEGAAAADRDRILSALHDALETEDAASYDLIQTATRLQMHGAAPALLQTYLAGRAAPLRDVLRAVVPTLDEALVVQQIERAMPRDIQGRQRAIQILGDCPGEAATRCLHRLAEGGDPAVAVFAESCLAARRAPVADRPRFRAINPKANR